jgi:uncharacterized repeat protein (TIGR03943 family)
MVAAVTEEVRATTILLVGALLMRLSIGGEYTRYVRVGMGPILLVSGILLAVVGLAGVVRALRGSRHDHDHDHGHDHGSDRVGWLLLAPVLALLLVTPPSLGSFGVSRSTAVTVSSGDRVYSSLRPGPEPVEMTLLEFDERVADHKGASFGSVPVKLVGFVSKTSDGDGFQIARFQIACCAADGVAFAVRVTGAGRTPAREQWVTVVGTYQPEADGTPRLQASSLTEIPPPREPYE